MIRKLLASLIILTCFIATPAFAWRGDTIKQGEIDLKVGYRMDQHEWTIGEPAGFTATGFPNIASELIFEDVESAQAKIEGSVDVGRGEDSKVTVHVRASLSMGTIYDGVNSDDDYAGDNRTLPWVQSIAEIDGDNTVDWEIALGPKFYSENEAFYILPHIGYSYNEAYYLMQDGIVTLYDAANRALLDPVLGPAVGPIPVGPFIGLNSSYNPEVEGMFYGLEFGINPTGNFRLIAGGRYHNYNYDGYGRWNLRSLTFNNGADGDGYTLNAEIGLGLGEHWMLTLAGEYRDWRTKSGRQVWTQAGVGTFWQNFNGADMESIIGFAGLQYNF